MPKPHVLGPQRRTNPFIWCSAIICAILATIVIFAGIVVFSSYLIIRPKLPLLSVSAARLDRISYDQAGVLAVQLTVIIKAENHNLNAHASFDNTKFTLGYHGLSIAHLVADPFDVGQNTTVDLHYFVESSPIPLSPEKQYLTQQSLNRSRKMMFVLKGNSRTRWRIGPVGRVKFWLHMNCELLLPINGSVVYSRCILAVVLISLIKKAPVSFHACPPCIKMHHLDLFARILKYDRISYLISNGRYGQY